MFSQTHPWILFWDVSLWSCIQACPENKINHCYLSQGQEQLWVRDLIYSIFIYSVGFGTTLTWTLVLPLWSVYLDPKSKVHCTCQIHNYTLLLHSIFYILQKTFFQSILFLILYYFIILILVKNSMDRISNDVQISKEMVKWLPLFCYNVLTPDLSG